MHGIQSKAHLETYVWAVLCPSRSSCGRSRIDGKQAPVATSSFSDCVPGTTAMCAVLLLDCHESYSSDATQLRCCLSVCCGCGLFVLCCRPDWSRSARKVGPGSSAADVCDSKQRRQCFDCAVPDASC